MNRLLDNVQVLLTMTKELNKMLQSTKDDDLETIIAMLHDRDELLAQYRSGNSLASALKSKKSIQNDKLQMMVKEIMLLDKQNMEAVEAKLRLTTVSLSELNKQRGAINKWRSMMMLRKKHIVDFLH
jgi:predicted oxidoreductase